VATKKRSGLGRGIGSLIPSAPAAPEVAEAPATSTSAARARTGAATSSSTSRPVDVFFPDQADVEARDGLVATPGARLAYVSPELVIPNPQQPRKVFNAEDFAELVHSIREVGILQPIVVREIPGSPNYELIMGERRLRASKEVGLDTIPVIVRDTADEDMLRDALLENLHRSQLNPLEEASAYQQLMSDFGITQDQLAEKIGRSRPQISNTIRLLKLPPQVQLRVAAGVLSAGHARAILSLADTEAMSRLADRIVNEGLSVRAAEELAQATPTPKKPKTVAGARRGHLDEVASRLGDRLNTRVRIALGAKKGQLSIEFATVADLNRILEELGESPFGS
jgi:ParB family chromosome partitioning protein